MSIWTRIKGWLKGKEEKELSPVLTVTDIIKSLEVDGLPKNHIAPTLDMMLREGCAKKQNRDSVVKKAKTIKVDTEKEQPASESEVKPDIDWLNRLFSIVENISDDDMQNLWAQILAGETKTPQSYSLKTLDVLRNMSKKDARLYVEAMKYQCFENFIISEKGCELDLDSKILLTDIGLISSEDITRTIKFANDTNLRVVKNGFVINVDCDNKEVEVSFKGRRLTNAGYELLQLLDPFSNQELFDYVGNKLLQSGAKEVSIHKILSRRGDYVSYEKVAEKTYKNDGSQTS